MSRTHQSLPISLNMCVLNLRCSSGINIQCHAFKLSRSVAMSWFNSSASSIRPWLDFNGTLPTIGPCKDVKMGHREAPRFIEADCTTVCNHTLSLYGPLVDNLVTCGLWTTLISAYTTIGPENCLVPNSNEQSIHLLDHFRMLGFHGDVHEQALAVADSISGRLQHLHFDAKFLTSSNDGTTPVACTRSILFPLGSNSNSTNHTLQALRSCLQAICSPITLNPDLAGIGVSTLRLRHHRILNSGSQVFSSFLIQSGIAILAFIALLGLEIISPKTKAVHTKAIITTLVNFHKSQCYFSSTVQITGLILFCAIQSHTAQALHGAALPPDIFDLSVLTVLALSGLVPVSFTLVCLIRYGHRTWHLIILSLITMAISTGTLSCPFIYLRRFGDPVTDQYLGPNLEELYPLCGSSKLRKNDIGTTTFAKPWIWAVWLNCVIWMIYCSLRKAFEGSRRVQLLKSWKDSSTIAAHVNSIGKSPVWLLLSMLTWMMCFGWQFNLFSAYFQHTVILQDWSFGQIIAVAVWMPAVFEYFYILCQTRYTF